MSLLNRYNTTTNSDSEENPPKKPRKKSKKTLSLLLSCCLFLAIACACLLAALILIGKHLVYNNSTPRSRFFIKNSSSKPTAAAALRLTNETFPLHYDITLKPRLDTGLFTGVVNITVNVTKTRKAIVLHGKNLNFDSVELRRADDLHVLQVDNVQENVIDEVFVILPKQRVEAGLYFLVVKYNGNLTKDKMVGFYKSVYKNSKGENR